MTLPRIGAGLACILATWLCGAACTTEGDATLAGVIVETEALVARIEAASTHPTQLNPGSAGQSAASIDAAETLARSATRMKRRLSAARRRALLQRWKAAETKLFQRLRRIDRDQRR